jgi:hypothetical protein
LNACLAQPRFRLPAVVEAGKPFTNHTDGFAFDPEGGWPAGIVGFATRDGLWLIIPKKGPSKPESAEERQFTIHPQTLYFSLSDNEWLPAHLYVKDTSQLEPVIDLCGVGFAC